MSFLTIIILLPFIGFLINGIFGSYLSKKVSGHIACLLPLMSFALTIIASYHVFNTSPLVEVLFKWVSFGDLHFLISLQMDNLSAIMTLIVTGIGSLIHIYSLGYMAHDESFKRYFSYLNLFLFFMLLLVLGESILVLFLGWEGVGLASYLLIGFWFKDAEKVIAGKKAFIVNRIGDAGFLIGIFLLFNTVGSLDLPIISQWFDTNSGQMSSLMINLIGIMLFIGATGKSAQLPLYVWLPDAMAGPTPVSALIHAATMVTAGVYMIARLSSLYIHADIAMLIIATVGALTALFSASMALVQKDIKKVLAYSTVSQLGFMFLSLGVGAFSAAIFHLFTHAFFKACLFLGAGSVIHALHEEQDITKMGGLYKKIPITALTFFIATLAISGIPPFAGFFSKDEILWAAYASPKGHILLWLVGSVTALLTSFYMFRLFFLTFIGNTRYHHPEKIHESPISMTSILGILALGSALVGFLGIPPILGEPLELPNIFEHILGKVLPALEIPSANHEQEFLLMGISVMIAIIGMGLAYYLYRNGLDKGRTLSEKFKYSYRILFNKYYIDELYNGLLVRPLHQFAQLFVKDFFDKLIIDGFLDSCAHTTKNISNRLSHLQNGQLHYYLLFVFVGLFLALSWSLYYV